MLEVSTLSKDGRDDRKVNTGYDLPMHKQRRDNVDPQEVRVQLHTMRHLGP